VTYCRIGSKWKQWMQASAPREPRLIKHLLGRRLEGFALGSSLALFPTFASMAVLLAVYGGKAAPGVLLAWAGAAFLVISARIVVARRILPLSVEMPVLRSQWRTVNIVLVLGSLAWTVGLPLAAWLAPAVGTSALSMIGAALLCGVLLMHRTAPAAAVFHILALAGGLALAHWIVSGWQAWPLLALIAIYAVTLIGAILYQDRLFRAACQLELDRRESERTVSMLLNDHEAQAADWLWTVDEGGALRDVSSRLAEVLQADSDTLSGQDFLSLIEPGRERDRIARSLSTRTAFRDQPAPVSSGGERRIWRLSGHPRPDGGMTGVGRDVTDQREIEERVRAMAYIDPLTGLANRHLFNLRLRELLSVDRPDAKPVALLYLDLDDFKSVNDAHGHVFGDSLLREMGARLRRESRESDVVARLGGDEFAILVEAPGGDGMLIERAHRLLATAREPFQIEGEVGRVSASIGIARPADGCEAAELMRRVELALYAAKAKGRDQMAIFDEALDRRARERRSLELELREAVGRGEMVLHYQPIIALRSGATVGYEALLRWRHPRRGLLLPDQFLPIAEESGLIVALGDWVIRTALADVAGWRGDFRIALNLSPSQIRNPNLIATVDGALVASGIAAGRLELEITESVLLDDAVAGAAMIKRLRALGAEIALDDFGTGYSSLSYLRRFRFDRVKIDRTFVRDIETSDEAQAIVSAITRLAEALGMRTTAEGVERPEQLDLLRKLGCDEAQGFLILEPVEAERIEQSRVRGLDLPEVAEEIEEYREARRAALAGLGRRKGG
jgi:diguanylate cyclase (GGDEF)-like protein